MINSIYDIKTESDTSMVINYFDIEFILDIVQDNLYRRIQIHQPGLPNILSAIEQNYKIACDNAVASGNDVDSLSQSREEIYLSIINTVANHSNISIESSYIDANNLYQAAYLIYDIFVANYKKNIIAFFSNYIMNESDAIYKGLNLEEFKKNKDSSTMYGKALYEDPKIAIINANIEYVLYNMGTFSIPFEYIIRYLYGDINADFILPIIYNNGDFFKEDFHSCIMNPMYKNILVTDIRFMIHQLAYQPQAMNI